MLKGFIQKKKTIKNLNSKITTNSQLSTTKPKTKHTKTKQTTGTGTESQKWRSHGGLSVGRRRRRMRGKVLGIRSIIDRYKIGDIKNSIGNGEVKEFICTTHGHELKGGNAGGRVVQGGGK